MKGSRQNIFKKENMLLLNRKVHFMVRTHKDIFCLYFLSKMNLYFQASVQPQNMRLFDGIYSTFFLLDSMPLLFLLSFEIFAYGSSIYSIC